MDKSPNSNQVRLILLLGLPGSGKSTLAESVISKTPLSRRLIYVEADLVEQYLHRNKPLIDHNLEVQLRDLINSFTGRSIFFTKDILAQLPVDDGTSKKLDDDNVTFQFDPNIWRNSRLLTRKLVQLILENKRGNSDPTELWIVVDDDHLFNNSRKCFFQLAKK
jgi:GTPase SAR1 family protein